MDTLWDRTLYHLDKGNFSRLQQVLGGPAGFNDKIVAWHREGKFDDQPEAFAEAFSCSCMLGNVATATYLLDHGVDPYAGMKTGLSGFHYAVSSGRLDVVRLLINRGVPMEVENMYGGTVWGQALWSAVNEHARDHAAIIEALLDAGPVVEEGTLSWWEKQNVPSADTKRRVADALRRHGHTS